MTKFESARLYRDGAFGNHARQWLSFAHFFIDIYGRRECKHFAVRGLWPGGPFFGPLLRGEVYPGLCDLSRAHRRPKSDFYVSEMVDNRLCILNGEVMRGVGGLELHFATVPQTMRVALKQAPQHAHGLKAQVIIDHLCCARGRDAIMELLDEYPNHIVEFAAFSRPVGLLGWNTIIWEVRDY